VQTVNPANLELRFSTTSVTVGKGLNGYLYEVYVYRTLNGAYYSGPDALTVTLACTTTAVCTVPVSVTIPANSASAYFQVTGVGVGSTTVTASATGYSSIQDLNVSVVTPVLQFSGLATSLRIGNVAPFQLQTYVPGAVYANSQGVVSEITINLTSAVPGVASVTPSVTITAGQTTSGPAQLTGVGVGTTNITASALDFNPATSPAVTVSP
jgi:hypothetical protein